MKHRIKVLVDYHSHLWPHAKAEDETIVSNEAWQQLVADLGAHKFQHLETIEDEQPAEEKRGMFGRAKK